MIQFSIILLVFFAVGYYVGSREVRKEVQEKIEQVSREQVKPGVVRHLTDAEIREKHDPGKRGNLEAFNEFFKNFPVIGKLRK